MWGAAATIVTRKRLTYHITFFKYWKKMVDKKDT